MHDKLHAKDLPARRVLPHLRLSWPDTTAVYLVTVCTRPRGRNQLASGTVAAAFLDVLQYYRSRALWHPHACVLMPDHVHLIVGVPAETDLVRVVSDAKRFLARSRGVRWQRGFHDRRLRRDEHYDAKVEYLRQNPVRAGLVSRPEDWPYFWHW